MVAPNKFQPGEAHLFIQIKFYIGGKSADDFIITDLSKKHVVRDVIKYVLTLIRKDAALKNKVQFRNSLDDHDMFELRHIDDDCSSDGGSDRYGDRYGDRYSDDRYDDDRYGDRYAEPKPQK